VKAVSGTVTVSYVHNPTAVAEAKKLMAYYERRYLERRAEEQMANRGGVQSGCQSSPPTKSA
jgi:hypothetical protein